MSDSPVIVRIYTGELNVAVDKMIAQSKQELSDMMVNEVGRPLIRKIISLTPPSQGNANMAAKKAGEMAVKDDISRIMRPGSPAYLDFFRRFHHGDVAQEDFAHAGAAPIGLIYTRILSGEELKDWHQQRRSQVTGRVGFRGKSSSYRRQAKRGMSQTNRERAYQLTTGVRAMDLRMLDLGLASKTEFARYIKSRQANVGWLAAGWNAPAARLGYVPPKWIARHGEKAGQCVLELEGERLRIFFSNDIGYVTNVKGLQDRVQKAVDWQTRDMLRRVDAFASKTRSI